MKNIKQIIIPRCYCKTDVFDPVSYVELHGFSDASESAFGACIYFRVVKISGNVKMVLVTSKSRVASSKTKQTIPRLELLGNLILSNLVVSVTKALEYDMKNGEIYCWTDSKVTRAWIKAKDKEFKVFVQNRVLQIGKNINEERWFYCRSEDDPADILTRSNNDPNCKLWWEGPQFLNVPRFSVIDEATIISDETPGFRDELRNLNETSSHASVNYKLSIGNIMDIQKHNDLMKLLRITAFVLRFIGNLKAKLNNDPLCIKGYAISDELRKSKVLWIKDNQIDMNSQYYNATNLNLNLKEDEIGVLRTFSRFNNASMPFVTRAPIFINTKHKLADLIVLYCHEKVLHRGIKQTLTEVRVNYWLPRGRSFVKMLLHPCVVCRIINTRCYKYPEHSNLPKLRFDERYAFSSLGLDHLGPLFCLPVYGDEQSKIFKAWIVIYTCMTTRAVVLDVVSDTRACTFINSFRRFISRRGCPNTVVSDNGSSFTAVQTLEFRS